MGVCYTAIDKGKSSLKSILNNEAKYNDYSDSAFDKVDTDKNGYIEKEELTKLIQELINKIKKETSVPQSPISLNIIDYF